MFFFLSYRPLEIWTLKDAYPHSVKNIDTSIHFCLFVWLQLSYGKRRRRDNLRDMRTNRSSATCVWPERGIL